MKLICHIGTPKTGTTFLQDTFVKNRKWLRQRGVIYPRLLCKTGNLITTLYAVSDEISIFAKAYGLETQEQIDAFRVKLAGDLAYTIARAPDHIHTMLISSENLTGNLEIGGIKNFYEFFSRYFDEIEIVCYLRHQDQAILSMYAEYMRRGFTNQKFEEFVNVAIGPNPEPKYLNYKDILSEWINVFGRNAITVRLFDRNKMEGGDILNDFMKLVFKDENVDISEMQRGNSVNPSLSPSSLEFLRKIQKLYPYTTAENKINKQRFRLREKIHGLPSLPKPEMSTDVSSRIMKRFQDDNRWLDTNFFLENTMDRQTPSGDNVTDGNLGKMKLTEFTEFRKTLFS